MIEFAHRNRDDYDIVWWIAAQHPQLVSEQMAQLAEAIGLAAPTDTAGQATAALLDTLGRRGCWLLIFGDAESPDQLARFLPAGSGHVRTAPVMGTQQSGRHTRWRGEGRLEIKMVFGPDTPVHHLAVRRTVSGSGTGG